ncbi:hypothetical protein GCM10027413_16550 [Conyzicola nivalis]|uniref:Uncharacterized protein n=1 Tax=Conyzicola nivalis TaxID=1477021 RepID=A0A916SEZ1_9MICO|nr:hypothetical protein GCM10010979_10070 [Conyzicola nivalis]
MIVIGIAAAIVVTGFAGEQALVAVLAWGAGPIASGDAFRYAGGVALLTVLYVAAVRRVLRHPQNSVFAAVLVGVSVVGVLFSVFLALLGSGLWAAARGLTEAESLGTFWLFLVAVAAPSLGSLLAAIVTAHVATRPAPTLPDRRDAQRRAGPV